MQAGGRWPRWLEGLWTEKDSCRAQRQSRIRFKMSVWAGLHLTFSRKLRPCSQMKHFFSLSQLFIFFFFWVLLGLMTQSYKPSLSSGWDRRLTNFRLVWAPAEFQASLKNTVRSYLEIKSPEEARLQLSGTPFPYLVKAPCSVPKTTTQNTKNIDRIHCLLRLPMGSHCW